MYPTLLDIECTLSHSGYPEYLITDWAMWLHENFHAESTVMKMKTFGHFVELLRKYETEKIRRRMLPHQIESRIYERSIGWNKAPWDFR